MSDPARLTLMIPNRAHTAFEVALSCSHATPQRRAVPVFTLGLTNSLFDV